MDGTYTISPIVDDAASSNARSWKNFADQINGTWRKGAGNFIDCGKLLAEANEELPRDAFNVLVKSKLDFEASVARKLMRIAANATLCAHVHKLPPCWSTLYELSQLTEGALQAAFADGSIHPGMQRKDATALKPPKKTTTKSTTAKTSPSINPTELSLAWWQTIPDDRRRTFLDQLGREGLCAAMSSELRADLHDHVISLACAGANKSSAFAVGVTNLLHTALRCAEESEPNDECSRTMVAALRSIARKAADKGIARSDLVIATGKSKARRK